MIIVSACLAGVKCRYNGESKPCEKVIELVKQGKAIAVCPEQLGGLPTPRTPAEIQGDKVVTNDGRDVTKEFEKGAEIAFEKAKHCREAILKTKSTSCGCGMIYDGTFSGKLIEGDGIFTRLLKKNKIKVKTEESI